MYLDQTYLFAKMVIFTHVKFPTMNTLELTLSDLALKHLPVMNI